MSFGKMPFPQLSLTQKPWVPTLPSMGLAMLRFHKSHINHPGHLEEPGGPNPLGACPSPEVI